MRATFAGLIAILSGAVPALAQQFEFLAAPNVGLNRIYRVDRVTGEVGACNYAEKQGTIGLTLCYPAGEGAKPQAPGEYGLVSSRHQAEAGVFRINRRSGEMSICYVLNDEQVVCTPPAR